MGMLKIDCTSTGEGVIVEDRGTGRKIAVQANQVLTIPSHNLVVSGQHDVPEHLWEQTKELTPGILQTLETIETKEV